MQDAIYFIAARAYLIRVIGDFDYEYWGELAKVTLGQMWSPANNLFRQ